jgi:hypothetical protein
MISTGKLGVAFKILDECRTLSKNHHVDMWLEAYSNGREQGFNLTLTASGLDRRVSFSEDRSSDSIVVYAGKYRDFSMLGNAPNDELYLNRNFFDTPLQAAIFIAEYMVGEPR